MYNTQPEQTMKVLQRPWRQQFKEQFLKLKQQQEYFSMIIYSWSMEKITEPFHLPTQTPPSSIFFPFLSCPAILKHFLRILFLQSYLFPLPKNILILSTVLAKSSCSMVNNLR